LLRMLRKSAVSLMVCAMLSVSWAQTSAEWDSPRVHAIAQKLRCPCGCNLTMSCQMPPHPCPTCKKNRIRIYQMLSEGMSERDILRTYVAESGSEVLWVTPGASGKAAPYVGLGLGFGAVLLVIRRYLRQRASTPDVDPLVMERVKKEMAELD
jgi:cytochrome c-type biogenesis protein CcmH/NrfF